MGLAFLLLSSSMLAASAPPPAVRPVIQTETDLPTRFPMPAPPSELAQSAAYLPLLPALRAETERVLRDYDIKDRTIAQRLRLGLANIAVLERRDADALRLVADYRSREAKPQLRALAGLQTELAAVADSGGCDAAARRLGDTLQRSDARVVRDEFLDVYSEIQVASAPYYAGGAVVFDRLARERGSLDLLRSLAIARWRVHSRLAAACRPALTATARAWLDAPSNAPVDIWSARQPSAASLAGAKPVVIAVWDRGFDVSLFPGQIAVDPAEPLDGRDNDGNGVIDDSNGPTYDLQLRPRTSPLAPPTAFLRARLAAQMAYDKGVRDLRYGLDTPEAGIFADFARTASAKDQSEEFLAELENGGRVHGTACASEIADGAPYVRLYNVAALPWGRNERRTEEPYDEATFTRWAAVIDRAGARMRHAGVRVVNMSWGLTSDEITQHLLDTGQEKDPARAKARGEAMWRQITDALHRLMTNSPNILFVVGAGNSDQDDATQGDAVRSFAVPNLLIVGATGISGLPTSFTVTGKSVELYAQGEAVRLRWPGDMVVHSSGTSMSAPLVVRAAAQMLAVKPSLTAAQLRQGLLATATAGTDGLRLLHPADAVGWARTH